MGSFAYVDDEYFLLWVVKKRLPQV